MITRAHMARQPTVLALILVGLVVAFGIAGIVSFYADPNPDGLESVAQASGFAYQAQESATAGSPLADYGVSGVSDERVSIGLSGVIGVAVTIVFGFGLFRLLTWRRAGG
ncbi:MAG: PDGLE domain-containing protein [Candidatus Nanopelagicales bacterium]|nr:PDGLE domain-containing protein [Candidatus Nanopelagicales bacterium]